MQKWKLGQKLLVGLGLVGLGLGGMVGLQPSVQAESIAPVQVAQAAKKAGPGKLAEHLLSRDPGKFVVEGGFRKRTAKLKVGLGKRTPRMIEVRVKQKITKGDADLSLEVVDQTENKTSFMTVNEASGTGTLNLQNTPVLGISVLPDETYQVAGQTYEMEHDVVAALLANASTQGISNESYAAMASELEASENTEGLQASPAATQKMASITATASQTYTIEASAGAGGKIMTSEPSAPYALNCTTPTATDGTNVCRASISGLESKTLRATPNPGYAFGGWTTSSVQQKCSANTLTCIIDGMTGFPREPRVVVAASFFKADMNVSINPVIAGTVSARVGLTDLACGSNGAICKADFKTGTSVTLTATPQTGQTFLGWGGDCASSGKNSTCTVTKSSTVSAQFTVPAGTAGYHTVKIAPNSDAGIAATGELAVLKQDVDANSERTYVVPTGTKMTLTAQPISTKAFKAWGGITGVTTNPATITVDKDIAISSTTAAAGGVSVPNNFRAYIEGTINNGKDTVIQCGRTASGVDMTKCKYQITSPADVTLTIKANSGFMIEKWLKKCASAGSAATCTLKTPTSGWSVADYWWQKTSK